MNKMKNVKEALNAVELIDKKYNQTACIKQFTIDLIEEFLEELNCFLLGNSENSEEEILGSLRYKVSCALEICNNEMVDFHVIKELYDAVND